MTRSELGIYLEELRGKMSLRKAAELSGLSHTYIRDLEMGINRGTKAVIKPSTESLKALADTYGVSLEILLEKAGFIEEKTNEIPNELRTIIERFNKLDDDNQDFLLKTIDKLIKGLE